MKRKEIIKLRKSFVTCYFDSLRKLAVVKSKKALGILFVTISQSETISLFERFRRASFITSMLFRNSAILNFSLGV